MKKLLLVVFGGVCLHLSAQNIVADKQHTATYSLVSALQIAAIYTDTADDWLVQKAAGLLQQDIASVTGKKPAIVHQLSTPSKSVIVIGSLDGVLN